MNAMRVLLAVLVAVIGAMFVACGGGLEETKTKQTVEKGKAEPKKGIEWAEPGRAVRQGDVRVSVVSYAVGRVPLKDAFGDQSTSKDELLQIVVKIENLSDSKKVEYSTWASAPGDFGSEGKARLEDNFGNRYDRARWGGLTTRPVEGVLSESIYPGKSVTDVLIFDPPVKKAKLLKLELPAEQFGGEGMLRLQIKLD